MKIPFITSVAIILSLIPVSGYSQTGEETSELNELQDELRFLRAELVTVETASNKEETLADAPATMVVVTAEEIKQRGYTDLTEVIQDLPGFDVTIPNGTAYMIAYQRGYRTIYTNRTLFMINGIVDNMLWAQEAAITRQYPLSNIKRIEVLYGPASAVYGPNAFLGIVNIITYSGKTVETGTVTGEVNTLLGSYDSKGLDATVRGKLTDDLAFSISGKLFKSDEPDLSGKFGFLNPSLFNNRDIWGAMLDLEHEKHRFGRYYDPTDDYGIIADLHYKNTKLGLIHWKRKEGYGPYYAADRTQNNAFWNKSSDQYFVDHTMQLTDVIKSHSLLLYRDSRRYGYWVEAEPDWNEGMEKYAYISFTHWNSDNNSWLFKQDFEIPLSDTIFLSSGLKYERKELTMAYDVPGYWSPAISSSTEPESGIGHSTDATYTLPPPPLENMPSDNLATTRDVGGYVQGIINAGQFRFNLGLRYDKNSVYGDVTNPRLSAIYKYSTPLTFKLLYGEAFQEPSPLQLWGGWSGRLSNPEMKPEKVRNIEFVALHQLKRLFHEVSIYYAQYTDVIKEEAENAGERDIYGLEYRAKMSFPNFIPNATDITADFNYTFTDVTSSVHYNHNLATWENGNTELGDIAPHKFNLGLNIPLNKQWHVNLRGNFVGERELYTRNPLRAQNETLDAYFTLDGVLGYQQDFVDVTLKVNNLLDEDYFHPGAEVASSGNDFSQRSQGYHNSIVPQPGRSFWLNVGIKF